MNLLASNLPSKGKLCTMMPSIDIPVLTFKELKTYNKKKADTDIEKVIRDIELIISGIQGWQLLSAYDCTSLAFLRKYISSTKSDIIVINVGNELYKLDTRKISMKSIDDHPELLEIKEVKLCGKHYDFAVPNMITYLNNLKYVSSNNNLSWLDKYDVMVLSCLGMTDKNIDEYTYMYEGICDEEDINEVEKLLSIVCDELHDCTVKSATSGGELVVNVNSLITDLFRLIRINTQFAKNQSKFDE